jgi:hypothetical protein
MRGEQCWEPDRKEAEILRERGPVEAEAIIPKRCESYKVDKSYALGLLARFYRMPVKGRTYRIPDQTAMKHIHSIEC